MIVSRRAYEPAERGDGYRVLIDRLWPRGVSKAKARLDAWEKEIGPTPELRKWYHHDPRKWPEFRARYSRELRASGAKAILADLARRGRRGRVTLVYASRAAEISDVAVLQRILRRLATKPKTKSRTKPRTKPRTKSRPKHKAKRGSR